MPVDQKHCRAVFGKLSRHLTRLENASSPDTVHKFRTSIRRVETVIESLVPKPDRGTKKLVKLLRRLRKKAGKVRDLDVQITALKNLKIARDSGQKDQLARTLAAERVKKTKKLVAALNKDALREIRKRLKRACQEVEFPASMEPVTVALQGLSEISKDHSPLNQKTVHQYRIAGKRARYLIEIAEHDPVSGAASQNLKKMQDVVGDWHDWLTLTERAEELFGGIKDSALVAAMQNLTRAKFRESVDAIIRLRQNLASGTIALPASALRKSPRKEPAQDSSDLSTAAA